MFAWLDFGIPAIGSPRSFCNWRSVAVPRRSMRSYIERRWFRELLSRIESFFPWRESQPMWPCISVPWKRLIGRSPWHFPGVLGNLLVVRLARVIRQPRSGCLRFSLCPDRKSRGMQLYSRQYPLLSVGNSRYQLVVDLSDRRSWFCTRSSGFGSGFPFYPYK